MDEGKEMNSCSTSAPAGGCTGTATPVFTTSSTAMIPAPDAGGASIGRDLCPPQEEARAVVEEGQAAEIIEQFLLNPEATELILGHLDMERLKTCRLVCRTWTFEISRMLKARAEVRLMNLKDFQEFKATCGAGAKLHLPLPFKRTRLVCMRLGVLPAVVEELQQYPLSIPEIITTGGILMVKFIERESRNRRKALRAQKAILLAIKKCGQALEVLGLNASFNMIGAQGFCFPNLKELWLSETPESEESVPQHENNLRNIFNSAPNLTHLQAFGDSLPKQIVESWGGLEKLSRLWLHYLGPPEDILIPMSRYEKEWALQSFHFYASDTSSVLTDTSISQLFFHVLAKVSWSIQNLAFNYVGKLVGAFPCCPCLTRLYLSFRTDISDNLSFANLKALKSWTQLPNRFTVKGEAPPGSIQPYKQLQRLCSLDLPNKYINNDTARSWFLSYSLAFPRVSAWAVNPVHLHALSALARCNQIRVQRLTVKYGRWDKMEEYLGAIKLIPGLEVLQLYNRVGEKIEKLRLNSIDFNQLPNLNIFKFYYSTYDDVMPVLEELKRLESVSVFGSFRTHRERLDDILRELPQAIGLTSGMLHRNRWKNIRSSCV